MNTEMIIGSILAIYFIAFISYAIHKEKKIHKDKIDFKIKGDS